MRETEREVEQSTAFKRDIRREGKGSNLAALNAVLPEVLADLVADISLPAKYQDHKLAGEWAGYRSCHIKPDLVLVYEKPDDETLRLARLGTHSKIHGL
jgi:mRNA interferase YafQ